MPNLRELRQRGPVPDVDQLLEDLLSAVARRHTSGKVHGALGPEAIRVTGHQIRLVPAKLDPDYAAPELEDGHAAAMAQDVYSVGATAWFLLTGGDPGSAPPRALKGYGWLDGFVEELTAPLDRRPLNGGLALERLRALRPGSSPSRRAPLVAAAAVLLVGLGGAVAWVISSQPVQTPTTPALLQPQAPDQVGCRDDKAQGVFVEALTAWQSCRFVSSNALYEGATEGSPSQLACREERIAAIAPHLAELKRVEADLDLGACHWARGKLDALEGFDRGPGCEAWLTACEEQELPVRQAQVKMSEARLDAALRSPIVTGTSFRGVPEDPWLWDIAVEGGWIAFFAQLEALLASQDQKNVAAATAMIGYLIAVCDAVGNESQNTLWSSRYLVFDDHGQCVHRLPTADAREVSRRLKSAQVSQDQQELVSAVEYLFSRLQDC